MAKSSPQNSLPILFFPGSHPDDPPGGGRGSSPRKPTRERQVQLLDPQFEALRATVEKDSITLRLSAAALAPERVIVFETAAPADTFAREVANIPGVSFLVEEHVDLEADKDFYMEKTFKDGRAPEPTDKPLKGRLYAVMPNRQAQEELLSLWRRWASGRPLPWGPASLDAFFKLLKTVRVWGPEDRLPLETREVLSSAEEEGSAFVQVEVEFWFRAPRDLQRAAETDLEAALVPLKGEILSRVSIPEVQYHGALIRLPAQAIEAFRSLDAPDILTISQVRWIVPQSVLVHGQSEDIDVEYVSGSEVSSAKDEEYRLHPFAPTAVPILALLDGVPFVRHPKLDGRLILDDPDNFQTQARVSQRHHGTGSASAIVHGDLEAGEVSLPRPILVRPILVPITVTTDETSFVEQTPPDRLLADLLLRAVRGLKEPSAGSPYAESIRIVSLAVGDIGRPFANQMSPAAKVIDYLANHYNLLFLISAGNVGTPLPVPGYDKASDHWDASPQQRMEVAFGGMNLEKHLRTLLPPSESINALTIGASNADAHPDYSNPPQYPIFDSDLGPSVLTRFGLGMAMSVKPDVLLPGGKSTGVVSVTGDTRMMRVRQPRGTLVAGVDNEGRDRTRSFTGTSASTAAAARMAHRIVDELLDRIAKRELDPGMEEYAPLIAKALIVSSARIDESIHSALVGLHPDLNHAAKSEHVTRFLGYGIADPQLCLSCAENRAIVVGYGSILPGKAQTFDLPIPTCLQGQALPREATLTIAWFSPVAPDRRIYRRIALQAELGPTEAEQTILGVERLLEQPFLTLANRGTVFHAAFRGTKVVPIDEEATLPIRVWCRQDKQDAKRQPLTTPVRYAVVVSLASEQALPIYDQVRSRLDIRPETDVRPRVQ